MTEKTKEIQRLLEFVPEGVDLKAISKINYPSKYFPESEYGISVLKKIQSSHSFRKHIYIT